MGLQGVSLLAMDESERLEKLMVIVETNTCAADGIQVSTGCTAGGRRLRVFEYGKSAAVFYDGRTGLGYRVATKPSFQADAATLAVKDGLIGAGQAVEESSQLERKITMNAFLRMTKDELFDSRKVRVDPKGLLLQQRIQPRQNCARCGEPIMDGKGITSGGEVVCYPCFHGYYYTHI